jgi:hypothetical protein
MTFFQRDLEENLKLEFNVHAGKKLRSLIFKTRPSMQDLEKITNKDLNMGVQSFLKT